MPGPADNVPTFKAGDPLSAGKLNQLGDGVRHSLTPGSMRTGAYHVQKRTRIAEDVRVQEVAIIADIEVSAWSAITKKKTRVVVTSPVFHPHVDGDDTDTIDPETTITYTSNLKVVVNVTPGKFKRGIVIGGKLIQVQCDEEELPEDWEGSS